MKTVKETAMMAVEFTHKVMAEVATEDNGLEVLEEFCEQFSVEIGDWEMVIAEILDKGEDDEA